jgi:hypothetical protein
MHNGSSGTPWGNIPPNLLLRCSMPPVLELPVLAGGFGLSSRPRGGKAVDFGDTSRKESRSRTLRVEGMLMHSEGGDFYFEDSEYTERREEVIEEGIVSPDELPEHPTLDESLRSFFFAGMGLDLEEERKARPIGRVRITVEVHDNTYEGEFAF